MMFLFLSYSWRISSCSHDRFWSVCMGSPPLFSAFMTTVGAELGWLLAAPTRTRRGSGGLAWCHFLLGSEEGNDFPSSPQNQPSDERFNRKESHKEATALHSLVTYVKTLPFRLEPLSLLPKRRRENQARHTQVSLMTLIVAEWPEWSRVIINVICLTCVCLAVWVKYSAVFKMFFL